MTTDTMAPPLRVELATACADALLSRGPGVRAAIRRVYEAAA